MQLSKVEADFDYDFHICRTKNSPHPRALTFLRTNRYSQALAEIDKAIDMDPVNSSFWSVKADVLERMGLQAYSLCVKAKAHEMDRQYLDAIESQNLSLMLEAHGDQA